MSKPKDHRTYSSDRRPPGHLPHPLDAHARIHTQGGRMPHEHDNPNPCDPPQEILHREDWELVQACVRSDRNAWIQLLERYERTLYFAVLGTLRNQNASTANNRAEDVQGDLIVALARNNFRRLSRYSGRCKLGQWLKVVATNFTIDHLRRKRPTVSLDHTPPGSEPLITTLPDLDPTPDQIIHQKRALEALRSLYPHLPEEDQRFIQLFYYEERSFAEIAKLMNTTLDAMYTRKNRVRHRLIKLAQRHGLTPSVS